MGGADGGVRRHWLSEQSVKPAPVMGAGVADCSDSWAYDADVNTIHSRPNPNIKLNNT